MKYNPATSCFTACERQVLPCSLPQAHSQDSDGASLDSQPVPALSCWLQRSTTATEKALPARLGSCLSHSLGEMPKEMKMEQSAYSYLYLIPAVTSSATPAEQDAWTRARVV